MIVSAELSNYGCCFVHLHGGIGSEQEQIRWTKALDQGSGSRAYRLCNVRGILAVCSIPVATVEDTDRVFPNSREGLEEFDETTLIIELRVLLELILFWSWRTLVWVLTFNSGREDMVVRREEEE